ncbi:MAG: benzoate-CoA ligase family protein [Rhodospirillales bacterium]|nr:benzoate-CoA ligase family protein [Rhodospirillales bacterium]MCW8970184.1 benzoate-CoA ligase family protein [Rhodospirillales bacterium]
MTAVSDRTSGESMNAATAILAPTLGRGLAESPALITNEKVVSYGELDALSNRFANACADAGLKPGDRLLIVMLDRPELIYAYLGAIKAGVVPVAFNVRASARDLAYVIEDSACGMLLLDGRFLPLYEEAVAGLERRPRVVVSDRDVPGYDSLAQLMKGMPDAFEAVQADPDDMAFWMYTSGTTGAPKGTVHKHAAVLTADHYLGEVLGVGPGDRLFCSSKLFFAFALGHCFFGALRLGAAAILHEGWPSSDVIVQIVERHRPTVMFSVPTFYRNLLQDGAAASDAFRAVRHFVASGEKLPAKLFDRWERVNGRRIMEAIGATETIFLFLANRPEDPLPGSCGRPTPGTEVRLVAGDMGEITEPGVPGVLWVRMGSIAKGYWNNDEKTGEVFVDGWYCTRDMFAMDEDGYFHHQGRSDDMLKISGQWVSPSEIEEEVMLHPGVADAAVVGVPNSDGLIRLSLFMVPSDRDADQTALAAEVQEHLTATLSIYKCPRRVFPLDELPRTVTGKVQRFLLRQLAADQMGVGN